MRLAWGLILIAGCDRVYDLSGRHPPDAAELDGTVVDAPLSDVPIDTGEQCPSTTYRTIADAPARSTYRVVETANQSWEFAFADCRNDTTTGITHLVVFDDITELAALQHATSRPAGDWVSWAGYARNFGSLPLEFKAVTGEALSKTSNLWRIGEPDNGGANSMNPETVVWWINDNNGIVDGRYTDNVEGYVCECDDRPTVGIEFSPSP